MATPVKMTSMVDDRLWQRMIARMSELRKKSPDVVIRNVARDYVKYAAMHTRLAQKVSFRKVMVKGVTLWLPLKVPRYPVGRGFARLGWFKAMSGLGITMRNPNMRIKAYPIFGIFGHTVDEEKAMYTVGNKVPYIVNLDAQDGIDAGAKQRAFQVLYQNVMKYESKVRVINA